METINNTPSLSSWIWVTFSIGLVAVITFIYSQGNWRTTTLFSSTLATICLTIASIVKLNDYLQTHFIGQFDPLGLPYRKAGPGFGVFFEAWPLWLSPILFLILTAIILGCIFRKHLFIAKKTTTTEKIHTIVSPTYKTPDIQSKIAFESLKYELNKTKANLDNALEDIKNQISNNQTLEGELNKIKITDEKHQAELEDKILSLTLELQSKEEELARLETLNIEQEEKLLRLKEPA